ncbi:hypothetical protein M413DRAFT_9628 [Hebeloma cylindrosporum]|uniref:Uncharacterized protein n=1 Tax=Hebeloma cylindrosporum TaxID=76867 RepID=A0A0C3C468_HEBCY|nr:hypothetical protein M413DRAFT_9628 [Hebeloma cylindrosporum h7]
MIVKAINDDDEAINNDKAINDEEKYRGCIHCCCSGSSSDVGGRWVDERCSIADGSEAGAECARMAEKIREERRSEESMDGDGDVSIMGGAMGMAIEEHEVLVLLPMMMTTRPSMMRRNTGGASTAAAQAVAQMLGDNKWMSIAV